MLDFEIITKRPEKMSFAIYKQYRTYQNNVIKAYLKRGKVKRHEISFLRSKSSLAIKEEIRKQYKENPVPSTEPTIIRAPERKLSKDRVAKTLAWVLVAAIAVAVIAYHLW